MTTLVIVILGILLLGVSSYALILLRYSARVKTACTCGAATGKFISLVDKPVAFAQRLDEKEHFGRRWTAEDFGRLLPMLMDKET